MYTFNILGIQINSVPLYFVPYNSVLKINSFPSFCGCVFSQNTISTLFQPLSFQNTICFGEAGDIISRNSNKHDGSR